MMSYNNDMTVLQSAKRQFFYAKRSATIEIGFNNVLSFDTKSVIRISRESFDQQSPNFTRTYIPALSTATPDMTSLCTSGRKLCEKNVENIASDGFGYNFSRTV